MDPQEGFWRQIGPAENAEVTVVGWRAQSEAVNHRISGPVPIASARERNGDLQE